MEIKVEEEEAHREQGEEKQPLLQHLSRLSQTENKTLIQTAISQTFQSTAHLANLLPTGTVLAFQLLSPIFTNQGNCDSTCRSMTAALLLLCGLSCLLSSFTDSFRDKDGNVCYGFATLNGMWVIDVFAAVALFDQNVVTCFYPTPSARVQEILKALPVGIGVCCSMLFVVFPTTRHGIGFPLSAN
ncbi:hypothetical protein Golax_003923 [Gossypium laxum]|uniref:Uncharacterized protein n=1 Tax=Gossypium laxum TaxID=34288 RepID=A0A7J9AIQ5_9ROSI|nr:hypothetical protein [Gossypium laxum]